MSNCKVRLQCQPASAAVGEAAHGGSRRRSSLFAAVTDRCFSGKESAAASRDRSQIRSSAKPAQKDPALHRLRQQARRPYPNAQHGRGLLSRLQVPAFGLRSQREAFPAKVSSMPAVFGAWFAELTHCHQARRVRLLSL